MGDHELNVFIYTHDQLHHNIPLITAVLYGHTKSIVQIYFAMFAFWAVGLRSHPCPIMAFAYIM